MSPQRIARVIAQCDPDIVALQELDVRRERTQGRDQAEEIALALNMTFHFHPAICLKEEQYGDAILSRFPLRLVHSGLLPGVTPTRRVEPRGALWVEAAIGEQAVQVINTHLGLGEQERLEQVQALLGPDWLGHSACREPLIVCGDMNFGPRSRAYRLLASQLRDVQLEGKGRRAAATYPSRWPVARIDHIFVKGGLRVLGAESPRSRLALRASDHYPLVAELRMG
jgi:endonuclease/exonuclease/phosphatase family metal-dependent hydrolase